MPRLLVLLAVLLVAAACGESGDGNRASPPPPPATNTETGATGTIRTESEPTPPAPPPPTGRRPGEVLTRFVEAARRENFEGMWELLSRPSQERLGPTLPRFRTGAGARLAREVGSFVRGRSRVFLDEEITSLFAVAAFGGRTQVGDRRPFGTYAAALRGEGGLWRLELGGPVAIRPLGPDPGAVEDGVFQVAAEVESAAPIVEGGVWLDGQAVPGRTAGLGATRVTMFGESQGELPAGPHAVVAFASTFADASAVAWTFVYSAG